MRQHKHSPSQSGQPQQSPAPDGIQPEPLRDLALSELQDTRLSPGKAKRVWREIRALLPEEQIREVAREYRHLNGKLPTAASKEPVPTLGGLSWNQIDRAGRHGRFGIRGSLSTILAPLRDEFGSSRRGKATKSPVCEALIVEAAREYYARHRKLPTLYSPERLSTYPDTSWQAVQSAGQQGMRGLAKGRTLSQILAPLRDELGANRRGRLPKPLLTESSIIEAAREYYAQHGKLPTGRSPEKLSTHPGTSWSTVNQAGCTGSRGLTRGRTLAKILADLRSDLNTRRSCA